MSATKQLLASTGHTESVSIRAVADHVGVTSPSIYLHFTDKDDLIHAAVADVFLDLDRAMAAGVDSAAGAVGRLLAAGHAYVEFAVEHPEHYRVAFMTPHGRSAELDAVLTENAFANFHRLVLDCVQAGIFTASDPLVVTFGLWTAAHGVAALAIAKSGLPWGELQAFTHRVLCAAALGQAAYDGAIDELADIVNACSAS